MIAEVTYYQASCDRCGQEHWPAEEARTWVDALLREAGWTTSADGRHICAGCVEIDRQNACAARPEGHNWFTPGDPSIEPYRDERGRYWTRKCRDCRRFEVRYEGGDWFGYDSRGRWLGDQAATPAARQRGGEDGEEG